MGGFSTRQVRDLLTRLSGVLVALFSLSAMAAQLGQQPILQLEAKIPLGDVRGRLDHMAFDLARQRLFVAELGNDSVGVVGLKEHKTIRTIAGLAEPQGVGYVASTDTLYDANARDGTVRLFRRPDYAPAGRIDRVYVNCGAGFIDVFEIRGSAYERIAHIPTATGARTSLLQPDVCF